MDPRRLWRIVVLAALVCGPAQAEEQVRLLVQSSPLAGFRYHAGAEVWRELRVGDRLELARDPDNAHDANAVRVLWRGRLLGYVPRRENAALAWALERGTPLRARISLLAEHPNPAHRIRFDVYVE
jgi:HIRAN domain